MKENKATKIAEHLTDTLQNLYEEERALDRCLRTNTITKGARKQAPIEVKMRKMDVYDADT